MLRLIYLIAMNISFSLIVSRYSLRVMSQRKAARLVRLSSLMPLKEHDRTVWQQQLSSEKLFSPQCRRTLCSMIYDDGNNERGNGDDRSHTENQQYKQPIVGYHMDEENDWVAELACGHYQHVRHNPPMVERPWVVTQKGRESFLGYELVCKKCADGAPLDKQPNPR